MVNIKDIAKAAGVSISTVSYALNGVDKVNEKTRQRIIKIADDINYIPNRAARTLKTKATDVIAIYLADFGGNFYGRLLDALKISLEKYHYEMIVCTGIKSHRFLPEQMVDAAVILDWKFTTEDILKYTHMGRKFVVLDREIDSDLVGQILVDNYHGVELVLSRLTETKTDKVFIISGPKNSFDNEQRLSHSVEWLESHAIDYEVLEGKFTELSGYFAAKQLVKAYQGQPLKVISLNDEMAVGVYRYLLNTDLTIGKDILIAGFDNSEMGQVVTPRLTSVGYEIDQWSDMIATMLNAMLNDQAAEKLWLPVHLTEGGSLG
ncbi:LacI family DNA-binding transcriptional regulator [Fundicoccus culcitae]|uniref:LacI family transcriptional regulator n=1 Tax=Fundicoccus culcitae TaxID=2969821 RepID=A0ABY5P944_9LACT|nr:LacI family DNA-binding transcriptional regulator [Fundicoccus culcitae]UUX34985.1 LacI family transcriptional regulator [Fundicoccus culcitae]